MSLRDNIARDIWASNRINFKEFAKLKLFELTSDEALYVFHDNYEIYFEKLRKKASSDIERAKHISNAKRLMKTLKDKHELDEIEYFVLSSQDKEYSEDLNMYFGLSGLGSKYQEYIDNQQRAKKDKKQIEMDSKDKKMNIFKKIYNYDPKKYKDLSKTKLFEANPDQVLYVIVDSDDKIHYEKLYDRPTTRGSKRQFNNVVELMGKIKKRKGIGRMSVFKIDPLNTLSGNVDDYLRMKDLYELASDYQERVKYEDKMKFQEKFKPDVYLKEGVNYYLFQPSRGDDRKDPKNFIEYEYKGLQSTGGEVPEYRFSSDSTTTGIAYDKLTEKLKKGEVLTDSDYKQLIIDQGGNIEKTNRVGVLIEKYKKNKSAENRDKLKKAVWDTIEEFESGGEFTSEDMRGIFRANCLLPKSHKVFYSSIVEGSSDKKFGDEIENPKKLIPDDCLKKVYESELKNIEPNFLDKELNKLMYPFVGRDDLRPVMKGLYFQPFGVTATNAHILAHYRIDTKYDDKLFYNLKEIQKEYKYYSKLEDFDKDKYSTLEKFAKSGKFPVVEIDGKYPRWEVVVPHNNTSNLDYVEINTSLLASTLDTLRNIGASNATTQEVDLVIKSKDDYKIGVNSVLFIECLKYMMRLGKQTCNLVFNPDAKNRAMVLVDREVTTFRSGWEQKNSFCLVMPVLLTDNSGSPVVEINEDVDRLNVDFFGDLDMTITPNDFGVTKKDSKSKLTTRKLTATPKAKTDKNDEEYIKQKIDLLEMVLEAETDKKEKDYLEDKIELYKMMM